MMGNLPGIRRDRTCPFCMKNKDVGLIACWPCYNDWGLRDGNPDAEAHLAARELNLTERGSYADEKSHD